MYICFRGVCTVGNFQMIVATVNVLSDFRAVSAEFASDNAQSIGGNVIWTCL